MTHDELVNAIRYCYNRYPTVLLQLAARIDDPRRWNKALFEVIRGPQAEETLPPGNPCETSHVFPSNEGLMGMCVHAPERPCDWRIKEEL